MASHMPSAPPPPVQGAPVQAVQATPVQATPVQATPVQGAVAAPAQGKAVQAASAPIRVDVTFGGAAVVAEGKRQYTFTLAVGSTPVHQFSARFSDLRQRCHPLFGEFPSRHPF